MFDPFRKSKRSAFRRPHAQPSQRLGGRLPGRRWRIAANMSRKSECLAASLALSLIVVPSARGIVTSKAFPSGRRLA